jgi:ankyrin repeat protein
VADGASVGEHDERELRASSTGCALAGFSLGVLGVGAVVLLVVVLVLAGRGCSLKLFTDACIDSDDDLVRAATLGESDGVDRLLGEGIDWDRSARGTTAMACAVDAGNVDIVGLLLAAGVDPQPEALLRASGWRGLELRLFEDAEKRRASDDELFEIAVLSLEHGLDPDSAVDRRTPLVWAAITGRLSMVDLLIDHGADPNRGSSVDLLAIALARRGWASVTEEVDSSTTLLFRPVVFPEGEEVRPLALAVWSGHLEIAARLLDAGADSNLASDDGVTPLHVAAARGDAAAVDLLLGHGAVAVPSAPPDVPSPAEAARSWGHEDLARHLDAAAG